MTSEPDARNFEALLARLQEIVETLDRGGTSLDDALVLYEEGVGIARQCATRLGAAEARLQELSKTVEGLFETRDIGNDDEDE